MAQVLLKTPLMASSSQSPLGSWRSIITCGRDHVGRGRGGERFGMQYLGLCSSHLDSSCNRFWIRIPSGESQEEGGGILKNV